ncbi:SDR family NAD(P)-dependent oxidoreductase [Noviherbaspirillum suwonense]|uniref:SDR family NAD(P)-dependent oxidoreductase n=1 Tax=Noviherbaspirillum suwonense TaxID=1224511 RepID=UPI0024B716A0|nr:SDR family NAD(P)-dependent oxidoreductase [Noviherbaspirillum suwonense]
MVSGAGSGIGKAIAFLYARLGAKLVICGRDPSKLETSAEWLRRLGSPDVLVQPMTIREPEQVEKLIDVAWLHFGRIDVLVNNAGGQFPQRALDYSVKGWKAVIDTNLNGTWYMMHALARRPRHAHLGRFQAERPLLLHERHGLDGGRHVRLHSQLFRRQPAGGRRHARLS